MNVQRILTGMDDLAARHPHFEFRAWVSVHVANRTYCVYWRDQVLGKGWGRDKVLRGDVTQYGASTIGGFAALDSASLADPDEIGIGKVYRVGEDHLWGGVEVTADCNFSRFRFSGPRTWDGESSKWNSSLEDVVGGERKLRDERPAIVGENVHLAADGSRIDHE